MRGWAVRRAFRAARTAAHFSVASTPRDVDAALHTSRSYRGVSLDFLPSLDGMFTPPRTPLLRPQARQAGRLQTGTASAGTSSLQQRQQQVEKRSPIQAGAPKRQIQPQNDMHASFQRSHIAVTRSALAAQRPAVPAATPKEKIEHSAAPQPQDGQLAVTGQSPATSVMSITAESSAPSHAKGTYTMADDESDSTYAMAEGRSMADESAGSYNDSLADSEEQAAQADMDDDQSPQAGRRLVRHCHQLASV